MEIYSKRVLSSCKKELLDGNKYTDKVNLGWQNQSLTLFISSFSQPKRLTFDREYLFLHEASHSNRILHCI